MGRNSSMLSIKLAGASLDCLKDRLGHLETLRKDKSLNKVDETVHGLGGINFVHLKLVCLLASSDKCTI